VGALHAVLGGDAADVDAVAREPAGVSMAAMRSYSTGMVSVSTGRLTPSAGGTVSCTWSSQARSTVSRRASMRCELTA